MSARIRQRCVLDYGQRRRRWLAGSDQRRRDRGRLTDAHIDGARIGGGDAPCPFVCGLALADARGDQADGAHQAALGQRNADFRTRRQRRRNARHDLVAHASRLERGDLLLCAAEEHRIAALQPHDDRVHGRRVDEPLVDELLRCRMLAAALADRDLRAFASRARWCLDEPARRRSTMSARSSSRAARKVSRSGAPGPAPTR